MYLQGAAHALALQQGQLQASKAFLAPHTAAITSGSHSFTTAAAYKCVLDSMDLVSQSAADMIGLDAHHDYSHKAPGWRPLQIQLQTAAAQCDEALSVLPSSNGNKANGELSGVFSPTVGVDGANTNMNGRGASEGVSSGSTPGPATSGRAQSGGHAAQRANEEFHANVDDTIKQILLWTQSMHSTETTGSPTTGAQHSVC